MKTTLELPDELMRAIKIRAAEENLKLKDLVTELLRSGLQRRETSQTEYRVSFPLVQQTRRPSGEDLSPEMLAKILIEDDEVRCLSAAG